MSSMFSVVRTEKKYSITWTQRSALMHRLSQVMKEDEYSGEDGYCVRSLYFDSLYDDDYFDKVNGLESRKKIRLRIYSPEQQQVKLELKQKRGAAQKKQSLWISRELAEEMISGNYSGLLETGSSLAEEIYSIMELGVYRPKCIIEYHRNALMEYSNDIRITLDSEIGVSDMFEDFLREDLVLIPVRTAPILEVKYNGFLLSNIKQILDLADASELAISKYMLCRQLLMP